MEITGGDELSRCIIFDRAFDGEVHSDELLWRFEKTKDDGASHESAILRRLAPEPSDVHRIGCGIAALQNSRKNEPPPGPTRRYYCGFRSASVSSLPTEGPDFTLVYRNVPEGGEAAHVDVALFVTAEGVNARANRRTIAGIALAEVFGPPEPHVCDCDSHDHNHPIVKRGPSCLTSGLRDRWPTLQFGLTHPINEESSDSTGGSQFLS